jgi:hypothetical protein
VAYVRHRYRIVAIDVLLTFNFAVVFILMYFHSRWCVANRKKNPRNKIILPQISLTLYGEEQFAAFCLFVRTLPIDFALLGRKREFIKSKTTAKLKGKQTSTAAVWDQFLSFATFPTPLLSRYRLPLMKGYTFSMAKYTKLLNPESAILPTQSPNYSVIGMF